MILLDFLGLQLMTGLTETEVEKPPLADPPYELDEETAELAGIYNNFLLVETELSSQQSPTKSQDDLANNSAKNFAFESSSPSALNVLRDVPLPSTSYSLSSIASPDSPVSLKSIFVKTNNEMNLLGKLPCDSEDWLHEKRALFSDKDEIFIIPSREDPARAHDKQEDYREFDTSLASTTNASLTSESITTAIAVMSNSINISHGRSPQYRLAMLEPASEARNQIMGPTLHQQ